MPDEPRSRPRLRVLRALLLWVVPPVALGIGAWFWFSGGRYASTDDAYVQADKTVVAAEVAGRVRSVAVAENEPVAVGQLLLELDTEALQLAVSRASAQAQSVRVQLAGLEAEYQEKVTELSVARQNADYAAREEARWRELAERRLAARRQTR